MKHLLTFLRHGVSATLALTVCSPSNRRRGTMLKHYAFMLLFLLGSLNVWGASATLTLNNLGTNVGTTSNTSVETTDIAATGGSTATYTLNYLQGKKQESAILLAGGTNGGTSFISNKTAMPGDIQSVKVYINSGASGTATYHCAFKTTECSSRYVTGSTAQNIKGGNNYTYNCSVSGARYFCIALGNNKNGQVLKVDVTYTTGGSSKTDVTDEQLSWSASSATVTYGDEPYSLPSLTNTIPVSVSYQSTDETVATISNTGVVSILKAGSTTIKAVYAGSETLNAKTVQYTLTVNKAAPTPIVGGLIDQLSISTFGVTGTGSYTAFTNKSASNSGHSPAVYAGTVARNGNSTKYNIQLNSGQSSNKKLREIATSTSGGFAKRVYVTWATESTNLSDRKLTVYGSNTAYNGSETASAGTKIGDIVFNTGDTYEYLDIAADYKYIQIVASHAIYMDQIDVTWVPIPTYAVNLSNTGCTLNVQKGSTPVADNDKFEEGTQLTVSYSASEGYENASLKVKKTSDMSDVTTSVLSGTTLTMPAYGITIETTATKKQYTVTLSATNGKIQVGGVDKTSIDVEHGYEVTLLAVADDDYAFQNWASEDFDIASPSNNPLTITIAKAGTITANFISTAKLNPGFAWSDASAVAVKGQEASLPTLTTNPYSLTPTYVSTNTDVAEINNAGEVTIKAVGSTTIKATYAEDPTYADCEATYTLTVKGRVTWHIIKEGVEETSSADYAKDVVPTKPVGVTSCDASISLVGWTTNTYAKSDAAPTPLYKEDVPVPAVTDNADYYAVWGVSSADSEASISEGVDTDGLIDDSWTTGGTGMGTYSGHGLKFTKQGDYLKSPNISSENLKSVVVKFRAGYNSQQNSGSVFTIYAYDSDDNVLDSKTCEPETDFDDQNDYSYTLGGSATIAYVKIALTTKVANVGMEYAELFKIIPGSTTGYTTNCVGPVVVADPEFDVATGTYYEVKTVKISNHDDDYLYFYTLDGTDPAADSNLDPTGTSVAYNHTTGIEINASCTLKAIAYDIDGNHSEVVDAAYVINLPLTTMDAIYAKAEENNGAQKEVIITFNNWVVSGVKDATAYVTDGTKGFIIYTTATGKHGLAVNDKISGTVTCQLALFNKAAEVVGLTKSDITTAGGSVTNDGVVTPVSKSIADLGGVNTGAPVIISNVTYNGTNSTLVDEDANAIKPYTTLYNYGSTFVNNKIYSVTGIYLQYNNTKELLPRQSEDIVLESKEQPTLKWYVNNTKETEIGATYTINKDAEFAPYFESNSDGAKTYNSTVETVASIDPNTGALTIVGVGETVISCAVEADGDYLAGSKSFTLKVRPEGSGDATWVAEVWAANEGIESNTNFSGNYETIDIDANVSMTWAKAESSNVPAYNKNDKEARLYNKATLTFNAANSKQITGIVFHFTSRHAGTLVPSDGSYDNSTWEGFTNSITFTNSGSAAYIKSIDIEYEQGTTTTLVIDDMIILNNASATDIVFTSNKPGAVVTYSDYDEDVITIAEGKVTPVAIGNTTVKASIAAEAPYSSVSITFNVRVKSSSETVENVVILSQFGEGWIAMKHDFTAVEVEKAADGTILDLTCDEEDITWVMIADGTSAMFQQPSTNKYLAVGSNNALVLSDDATVWTLSDDGYYYNVSGRTFLYQGGGAKYKNYSAGNAGKATDGGYSQLASFVAPVFANREDIRTAGISSGVWGTICPKKEVKYPTGASFFQISYVEYHSGVPYKVFYDEIAEGASLEAGHPYLFQADEDATAIKGIAVGDEAASAINDHGFKGVLENETISVVSADVAAYRYYIVYNNEIRLCGEGQFLIRAERAYLDMSDPAVEKQYKAPINGRRRVALTNNAPQVATGIDALNASDAPAKVLINGQLFIIRGEKMFDAKGQLVK